MLLADKILLGTGVGLTTVLMQILGWKNPTSPWAHLSHIKEAHAPTKSGIVWTEDLLQDPATFEFLKQFANPISEDQEQNPSENWNRS